MFVLVTYVERQGDLLVNITLIPWERSNQILYQYKLTIENLIQSDVN